MFESGALFGYIIKPVQLERLKLKLEKPIAPPQARLEFTAASRFPDGLRVTRLNELMGPMPLEAA